MNEMNERNPRVVSQALYIEFNCSSSDINIIPWVATQAFPVASPKTCHGSFESLTQYTILHIPASVSLPVAKAPLSPSLFSNAPPRRISQATSMRNPTHDGGTTSSTKVLRRVKSFPQQSLPSSKIHRTRSVLSRPSQSKVQVLTSTVQQVLSNPSNPPKYVARF
jgi:hypothetical protein